MIIELWNIFQYNIQQQKNKAGLTALQIAEKQGFKRIAYVLKTGQPAPDIIVDIKVESDEPKHKEYVLFHAAKNGQLKIIQEFIEDHYESPDYKIQLHNKLIDIAKTNKQHEVVHILQSYLDNLKPGPGNVIRLEQYHEKILHGFLSSLGNAIAKSPVVLDPADPSTYENFVSNINDNQRKQLEDIHKVNSERDAMILSEQDLININKELTNMNNQLKKFNEAKIESEKNIQKIAEELKKQEQISAIERLKLFKEQEKYKRQLAACESSISSFELQQEATLNRQKTVNFIHQNRNMYLFFRTIEIILQSLFHGALTARSGLFNMKKRSGYGTAAGIVNAVPSSIIPFCKYHCFSKQFYQYQSIVSCFLAKLIVGPVKSVISGILSKLDKKNKNWNIIIFQH